MRGVLFILLCIGPITSVVEQLGCNPGWIDFGDGNCYYAETRIKATRKNANLDCSNKDATLLRITSMEELTGLTNAYWPSGFKMSDGYWTDLTTLRFDGTKSSSGKYMWGTYIPHQNGTTPWEHYPTAIPNATCGALNIQGKMTNWNCKRRMGYICQMMIAQHSQCPMGWLSSIDSCYLFSNTTAKTQRLNWNKAKQKCESIQAPANVKMTSVKLLTIDDPDDLNLIASSMNEVPSTTTTFWIGLQRTTDGNSWKWYNNDLFKPIYIKWAIEPDRLNNNENCAIMKPDFQFADQDCSQKFNYICKKIQNQDNTQYFMGCSGWTRAGQKCYTFYDGPPSTWQVARSKCKQLGGDLIKVESEDERHWLEIQMLSTSRGFYWSGLNDQGIEGTYRWADGQLYNQSMINWNQEPNSFHGNEDCAVIRADGPWDDRDCSVPAPFICEYSGGACPQTTGWYSNPNSKECYYVSNTNDSRSWYEADSYCRGDLISGLATPLTVSLLALNSNEELTFIKGILSKIPQQQMWKGYWTDLNDRSVEGYFSYSDTINNPPNMNLISWKGEPYDPNGTNDCTYVGFYGRFSTITCNAHLGFICEKLPTGYSARSRAASNIKSIKHLCLMLMALLLRKIA